MKKTYISPELELIRFTPAERIANDTAEDEVNFSTFDSTDNGNAVSNTNYDFVLDL